MAELCRCQTFFLSFLAVEQVCYPSLSFIRTFEIQRYRFWVLQCDHGAVLSTSGHHSKETVHALKYSNGLARAALDAHLHYKRRSPQALRRYRIRASVFRTSPYADDRYGNSAMDESL